MTLPLPDAVENVLHAYGADLGEFNGDRARVLFEAITSLRASLAAHRAAEVAPPTPAPLPGEVEAAILNLDAELIGMEYPRVELLGINALRAAILAALRAARVAGMREAAKVCDEKARRMIACAEHGDARTCYELAAAIAALADKETP